HNLFHQGITQTLDETALDLPLMRERIDHRAHVVRRDHSFDFRLAGLAVDLDLGDLRHESGDRRAAGDLVALADAHGALPAAGAAADLGEAEGFFAVGKFTFR